MTYAGIVLCGGRSSRMGQPKAMLPFGPELMLQRVVRLLSQVVGPMVVVAAPGQALPELPAAVTVIRDEREGQGPLEGLRVGLTALRGQAVAAYATSCDVPLLVPAFVRRMFELFATSGGQIAVPQAEGFHHPLAAVYSVEVAPHIEQLLAAGRLRPVFLYESVSTLVVPAEDLRIADPELLTLKNLNHPADYLAALSAAGFEAPSMTR